MQGSMNNSSRFIQLSKIVNIKMSLVAKYLVDLSSYFTRIGSCNECDSCFLIVRHGYRNENSVNVANQ